MGTTADKGAYLNTTKSLLKQKINNLGGDITDQTTFRQYAEQLQNVYDILPKTDYSEGSNITLSNTLKGKLDFEDDIVGIGDTSQKSYEGYNLAPITDNRYNLDDDNIISISRHDDNNGIIYTQFDIRSGETIYLYFIKYNNINNNTSFMGNNDNTNLSFTNIQGLTNNTLYKKTYTATSDITIKITMWGNANNETLKFQLWATKDEAKDTFEPFVGNSPSPSPPYPQDIEVVRGKNLLDMSNAVGGTNNGITCTFNSDKSYSFKGTASNNNINVWFLGNYNSSTTLFTLKAGTYHIQDVILFNGTTPLNYSNFYNGPITLANDTNITGVRAPQVTSGTTYNETKYPMIVKGSQATSYLPYNTLEVVERGKNLAHIEVEGKYRQASNGNFATNSSFNSYISSVKPNTSYIASCKNIATYYTEISNLCFFDVNMNFISGNNYNTSNKAFTTPNNCYYVTMAVNVSIEELQIETGSTATDYEPYQTPQTYQLSLGEYEFAGIGTYVDTIEYDVDEDKVYKNENIGKKIYTGESSENWSIWQGIILIDDTTIKNLGTSNLNFYLNYFRNVSSIAYIGSNTGQRLHIQLSNAGLSEITSVSAWKTWLSTHNLEFVYVCNETQIEITDTTLINQVKALYYSQSFTGTTIIEINGNLPLIIKVRALKGE